MNIKNALMIGGFFCFLIFANTIYAQDNSFKEIQNETLKLVNDHLETMSSKPDTCKCDLGNAIGTKKLARTVNSVEKMKQLSLEGFELIHVKTYSQKKGKPHIVGTYKDCNRNIYVQVIYKPGHLIWIASSRKNGNRKYNLLNEEMCN